jgi:hypothetical protein
MLHFYTFDLHLGIFYTIDLHAVKCVITQMTYKLHNWLTFGLTFYTNDLITIYCVNVYNVFYM